MLIQYIGSEIQLYPTEIQKDKIIGKLIDANSNGILIRITEPNDYLYELNKTYFISYMNLTFKIL